MINRIIIFCKKCKREVDSVQLEHYVVLGKYIIEIKCHGVMHQLEFTEIEMWEALKAKTYEDAVWNITL